LTQQPDPTFATVGVANEHLTFWFPLLPPRVLSPNVGAHLFTKSKAAKRYGKDLQTVAQNVRARTGWVAPSKAALQLEFHFRGRRLRDADNLLASFKPGQDALVRAGILAADDADHLEIRTPIVRSPRAESGVLIKVWPL
jgi:hypothetical protein